MSSCSTSRSETSQRASGLRFHSRNLHSPDSRCRIVGSAALRNSLAGPVFPILALARAGSAGGCDAGVSSFPSRLAPTSRCRETVPGSTGWYPSRRRLGRSYDSLRPHQQISRLNHDPSRLVIEQAFELAATRVRADHRAALRITPFVADSPGSIPSSVRACSESGEGIGYATPRISCHLPVRER